MNTYMQAMYTCSTHTNAHIHIHENGEINEILFHISFILCETGAQPRLALEPGPS